MGTDRLYQGLSFAATLLVWELAAGVTGLFSPEILPPPLVIAEHTAAALADGQFLGHVVATVGRTLLAAAIASVSGTVVGLAMGWNRYVKAVLSPLAAAIFPLPMISVFPLLVLFVGSTERALIVTTALGSFFLVLWNARDGARNVESVHVDVARDNGATSVYALFREVLLPGSLPLILTGVRLGVSTSLLIVVTVEFVAGGDGLGYVLWTSWMSYRIPELYAALVVVGALGALSTYGFASLQSKLVPWSTTPRRETVL